MKFNYFHDTNKKTLVIPRPALQLSELAEAEMLTFHTEPGCVLVMRESMTASEKMGVIDLLDDLAVAILGQLVEDSRKAAEKHDEGCEFCDHDNCSGLVVPPCMLAEANIETDDPLTAAVEDGRIVITVAEDADDPLDELDEAFLAMLIDAGVDPIGLRDLLESDGANDE